MTRKKIFAFAIMMVLSIHGFADDITASKIFEKVKTTYKAMDTYKSHGVIIANIDADGMKMNIETSFSIILRKPNLYLITWTQKNMPMPGMDQPGAVWSDGTQPFLYTGIMNAYTKLANDEIALSSATGISGGAAFTIPSLFLTSFKNQSPFSRLTDAKLEKVERIEGEDCYVISGASAISKKETFWISKSEYLIMKCCRSLELSERAMDEIDEMTDEELEETIKAMGQPVKEASTGESKQKIRDLMGGSEATPGDSKMKASFTEVHKKIASPELTKKDFTFTPPEGTVLTESLFGEKLEGNTQSNSLPTAKQSDEELRETIIGTWHSVDRLVDGFSTFKADGKVEYAGTIKKVADNLEATPYTATGTYKIENAIMTVSIDTVSGSITGLWNPGMVIKMRLIQITETEWTYEITGRMASGPHTEQRVKK